MEKITKKHFIELLCAHESALACSGRTKENIDCKIDEMFSNLTESELQEPIFRTVKKQHSNSLLFSNGSSIYFDDFGEKTYHKVGSCIVQKNVIDYSKDNTCSYDYIQYCYIVYFLR